MNLCSLCCRGRFTLVRNVRAKTGSKIKRVAKILPYTSGKREDSLREYEMLKVCTSPLRTKPQSKPADQGFNTFNLLETENHQGQNDLKRAC